MKATSGKKPARKIGISPSRGMEAVIKAKLIDAVVRTTEATGLTHAEVARRSGLPRSAVTGILSGSLQKVTIDRVLRLIEAVGLVAEVKVKRVRAVLTHARLGIGVLDGRLERAEVLTCQGESFHRGHVVVDGSERRRCSHERG